MMSEPEMRFVSVEAAMEAARVNVATESDPDDHPDPDGTWLDRDQTRLLALARAQLEEWVRGLRVAAGVDQHEAASPQLLVQLVRQRSAGLPADDLRECILDAFDEAVRLRQALRQDASILLGHTITGEHTITLGPRLPALEILGVTGSESGEFVDDPASILSSAMTLTTDACVLAVTLAEHQRMQAARDVARADPQALAREHREETAEAAEEDPRAADERSQPEPWARRVANRGIWVRNGPSHHPDLPRAIAHSGPHVLYPGAAGWDSWDRTLGELTVIGPEDWPF